MTLEVLSTPVQQALQNSTVIGSKDGCKPASSDTVRYFAYPFILQITRGFEPRGTNEECDLFNYYDFSWKTLIVVKQR